MADSQLVQLRLALRRRPGRAGRSTPSIKSPGPSAISRRSVASPSADGRHPNGIGNIYDHFEVNYLYPNNVRAFVGCRQIEGCYNENSDYIMGTKGVLTIGRGPMPRIEGQTQLDL